MTNEARADQYSGLGDCCEANGILQYYHVLQMEGLEDGEHLYVPDWLYNHCSKNANCGLYMVSQPPTMPNFQPFGYIAVRVSNTPRKELSFAYSGDYIVNTGDTLTILSAESFNKLFAIISSGSVKGQSLKPHITEPIDACL